MIVHAIYVFMRFFACFELNDPAPVQGLRRIDAYPDSLKPIVGILASFDGPYGGFVGWVDVDGEAIVMMDVQSPALKPFQVDQITNVLLLLLVVDLVPTVEALYQLFL